MMTREQKHTIDVYLNALGGNGASKINGYLNTIAETADKLPESTERSTILDVTLQAHAVNNFDGKTLADFQAWNNAQPVEEPKPPEPPIVIQPPTGVVTVPGRWAVTATEAPQHFKLAGPASRVSIAVADGKQVWLGWSANAGEFKEGQASASSGAAVIFAVPAGEWFINYKLSPGMGGAANGDVSAY
jgi:hypothetical protein